MRNEMRISPKQDPGFMAADSLRIYFHISRFWFFNWILLSGKISLNRSPLFLSIQPYHKAPGDREKNNGRRKYNKLYSSKTKNFLDRIKIIFHNYLKTIIWWKNENSGHYLTDNVFWKINLNKAAIWCLFIKVEFSLKLNNVTHLGSHLQLFMPFI